MNSMGFIRGYMSKQYSNEEFMIHVGESMEKQLQEWDPTYRINIMKFKDYIFVVRHGDLVDYRVDISKSELASLQARGPYALDRKIWSELEKQGVEIQFGYGDYLEKVFGRR